jgi:hypothetical protein
MHKLLRYLAGTVKYDGRRQNGAPKGSYRCPPVTLPNRKRNQAAAISGVKSPHMHDALRRNLSHSARTNAIITDQGLAAAGMTVALISFAFAVVMVSQNDRGTVFERDEVVRLPSQRSTTLANTSKGPLKALSSQAIDFDTTGSPIPLQPGHQARRPKAGSTSNHASAKAYQQSGSYVLSFVHKNMALVKGSQGLYAAKAGTALPAAGNVLSIEKRGNNWVLVTERAIIAAAN